MELAKLLDHPMNETHHLSESVLSSGVVSIAGSGITSITLTDLNSILLIKSSYDRKDWNSHDIVLTKWRFTSSKSHHFRWKLLTGNT
jgi:hypothetical protein